MVALPAGARVQVRQPGLVKTILVVPGVGEGGGGSGDVTGPASSTNNNLAAYDGTTGKLLKDSGLATSAVATLASAQALTNKDLSSGTNTFPTFNQNTTGSAAKWTTARTVSLTGDVTWSQSVDGSANVTGAATLATVNSNTGSFGGAASVPAFSVNGKGLITSVTATPIALAGSAITSGTVPAARLGSGTADSSTFLRGDGTWATPPGGGGGSGDMLEATYDPQGIEDDAFDRANHTGNMPAANVTGLSTVATSGAYNDLSGKPTLGTAAAAASTDFATAAQGAKADSALQPAAIGTSVQAYDADLTIWGGKTAPSGTVVGTTDSQTLTNKTLTAPAISSPTGLVKADVGLGNVANVDQTNADNITSGTLADARIPSTITRDSELTAATDIRNPIIVLDVGDPVPGGTPAGTIIVRV